MSAKPKPRPPTKIQLRHFRLVEIKPDYRTVWEWEDGEDGVVRLEKPTPWKWTRPNARSER